jgi:hypothetical protein
MGERLVYLCDWLPPDFGAVGQYALAEARERAREGGEVTLVGLASAGESVVEERPGRGRLTVVRLGARTYDRAELFTRALWTLGTNLRLVAVALPAMRRADEVLFTGSPPFLVHLLVPLNLLLGRRLVYRITDFHPECLIAELGGAPAPLALFRRLTVALRRRVARLEVLGEDQRRRLLADGIASERISVHRYGPPVEVDPATRPLARPAELDGYVVLLYSGNFGVAHDHSTFLDGFRLHHRAGSGRVALWLNATGAKAEEVARALAAEGLPFHRSEPVPTADLAALLVAPDAHLITLRDEFVGLVLPSKVYGAAASGRPILFVGSAESDVHAISAAEAGGGYWRAAVGDPQAVAAALEQIADAVSSGELPETPSS